jgi:hypothetical protein
MTPALIFLLSVFALTSPPAGSGVYSSGQSSPSSQDAQGQATAPPTAPDTKPATPAPQPAKVPAKPQQGKKKTPDGCKNASPAVAASTPSASGTTSSGASTQTGDAAGTAKTCPPPKIVVRQGGTSEPSIQLAGGPSAGQATQAKDNAAQMLDSTEENLKKLSARQLSDGEHDTVAQIRQFMEQSKAAVAAGDSERARTLAWKAETLSEDLVNPKK